MTKYNCKVCGFSTERNSKPESCPYCSKQGVMGEEEEADEIVSEV